MMKGIFGSNPFFGEYTRDLASVPNATQSMISDHHLDAMQKRWDAEYRMQNDTNPPWADPDRERMRCIFMRLRLGQGERHPFRHLTTAETDDHILVLVVQKNEYVVLQDDKDLFPSDTLITQLRLLA